MRYYLLISFLILFSLNSFSEEGDKENPSEFDYSSISIDLIQTDQTAIGAKLSLPLPGGNGSTVNSTLAN